MFAGYLELGGTEIINSERTYQYVQNGMPSLGLENCSDCDDLRMALGDHEYRNAYLDQAPWWDPQRPETLEFYGLYPLEIQGLWDSVRTAPVTQLSGDGAVVGVLRHAGREIRVSALLLAGSDLALTAGLSWLRYACLGNNCRDTTLGCEGDELCYFATCPVICTDSDVYTSPADCAVPYRRKLYNVTVIDGPHVVEEFPTSCGAMCRVEFTMVAGVPWPYGVPIDVDCTKIEIVQNRECVFRAGPPNPTMDPDCPPPPVAPQPPGVPNPCILFDPPYQSGWVLIPNDAVGEFSTGIPVITISTANLATRQARVRFYPDPLETSILDLDPCSFCGEFIISYIAPNTTLVIDGIYKQATMSNDGGKTLFNATQLLYGSGGGPMVWPELLCGVGYAMTVDVNPSGPLKSIDLAIAVRE